MKNISIYITFVVNIIAFLLDIDWIYIVTKKDKNSIIHLRDLFGN